MRQILTVTIGNSTTTYAMDFFYDASGYPFAVKYNGDLCYYITNLQGYVMSIVDPQGKVVAEYEYDPYGNILAATGPLADVNPLRYRGYVYDTETQFYYLQSRYYDPELGRFINSDSYVSTGQGVLGNIMFAYCRNNPISRIDVSGTADADCFNEDGEILSNDDIENRNGGGGGQSSGRLFSSFKALKNYLGSPGENNHWHHIVEQCQTNKSGFTYEQINNTSNVIAVDAQTHVQITSYYNSTKFEFTGGLSVRNWLAGQPFQVQFDFGVNVLIAFGVIQ